MEGVQERGEEGRTWLTSWMTKLVGSVLTACHDTVCPEVPELQTVEDDGEVTWKAEVRVPRASEAMSVVKQYILAVCS